MSDLDDFLAQTIPRQIAADTALHNGDAGPRCAMWSSKDPVTLFGAAKSANGWDDVSGVFRWLASRFSDCSAFDIEVIAAGVSGDLAYTVAYEHTTASAGGHAPAAYTLRVTHVYRREDGEWRIVHRHGDPVPNSDETKQQVNRMGEKTGGR